MKKVLSLFLVVSFFILYLSFVPVVYAQSCPPCPNPDDVCTALGCISPDPNKFAAWVLGRVIGIGGGIAFLLMVFGGFQVITSSGNPEGTKKGTEMITAAVSGLAFIIFSIFLLKLIGIDILKLPGFS